MPPEKNVRKRESTCGHFQRSVNAQSFNSAITEYLGKTPEDEVPEDLQAIISSYDESKVGRVKASKKALEKLKTMKEG